MEYYITLLNVWSRMDLLMETILLCRVDLLMETIPPLMNPGNSGSQELRGVGGSTDPVMGKWHSYLACPAAWTKGSPKVHLFGQHGHAPRTLRHQQNLQSRESATVLWASVAHLSLLCFFTWHGKAANRPVS